MSELEELLATLTVEELRERILEGTRGLSTICIPKELDAFAAAVDARAYAKGVAEERERILAESSCIAADDRSLHQSGREFVTGELWYYFPASVLAPPKEREP